MYVALYQCLFLMQSEKSNVFSNLRVKGCHCIENKEVQGAMLAQAVKIAGCFIWTEQK